MRSAGDEAIVRCMSRRFPWFVATAFLSVALVGAAAAYRHPGATSPQTVRVAPADAALTRHLRVRGYDVDVRVVPNRAGRTTQISLRLIGRGRPVSGARVTLTTLMAGMEGYKSRLLQRAPGRYAHAWPPLMPGAWRLHFAIAPPDGRRFRVTLVDRLG